MVKRLKKRTINVDDDTWTILCSFGNASQGVRELVEEFRTGSMIQ